MEEWQSKYLVSTVNKTSYSRRRKIYILISVRNVCACSSFAGFFCAFIVRVPSAPKHDFTEVGSTSSGSWHLWVNVFITVPSVASCWMKCRHKEMHHTCIIQRKHKTVTVYLFGMNFNLIVWCGDYHVFRWEVLDIHCKLVCVSQCLDVSRGPCSV